jgi:hypothetical protein
LTIAGVDAKVTRGADPAPPLAAPPATASRERFLTVCGGEGVIFSFQGCNFCVNSCENILCGNLYDGDLVFVILKGIYGFKLPQRFLEISSRDLTSSFLLQLI